MPLILHCLLLSIFDCWEFRSGLTGALVCSVLLCFRSANERRRKILNKSTSNQSLRLSIKLHILRQSISISFPHYSWPCQFSIVAGMLLWLKKRFFRIQHLSGSKDSYRLKRKLYKNIFLQYLRYAPIPTPLLLESRNIDKLFLRFILRFTIYDLKSSMKSEFEIAQLIKQVW